MSTVFTHHHPEDGSIGIGKLPDEVYPLMEQIVQEYSQQIPDRHATTHHLWFEEMPPSLQKAVGLLQWLPLWKGLGVEGAHIESLREMDELYYSNPSDMKTTNLYGASGNFQIHRDCIFDFHGIRVYRALIGLTDGNTRTVTYFNHYDVGHKLNKGDYIVFDFDRTAHQVIKEAPERQPRILLKLHFLVIDPSSKSVWKNSPVFLHWLYTQYEYVTRYVMDTGTDPKTFYEFFWGVFCQWYCSPSFLYGVILLCGTIVLILHGIGVPFQRRMFSLYVTGIVSGMVLFFMVGVLFYWGRYRLTGIK
jgi:hypothetical protein